MSGWNSVNDCLPDTPRKVEAVYRGNKTRQVIVARYAGGQWRFLIHAHRTMRPDRVTHWQELPELPQEAP